MAVKETPGGSMLQANFSIPCRIFFINFLKSVINVFIYPSPDGKPSQQYRLSLASLTSLSAAGD
jgi:hypothetical protein